MRLRTIITGLLTLIVSSVTATYAQGVFTQTVTALSTNCNATCSVLDVNALSNNPAAIVFITPSGGTANPHLVGAYYMYLNKWSIFNLDGAAIAVGAKFTVEYSNPDANHFLYVVPQRVSPKDTAYIDHAGLNGNPGAHIRVIPHITSTIGNQWNRDAVKAAYDGAAAKWFLVNINGTPVPPDSAYNIVVSDEPVITNPHVNNPINTNPQTPVSTAVCNCVIPTSLPPNGTAGGDLDGSYPAPRVIALQGKPLSSEQPKLGQILKWSIAGWVPADESAPPPTPKPSVVYFTQTSDARLKTPNVDTATIPGLNDQTFTLTQNSRVVFNTVIRAQNEGTDDILNSNPVHAWVLVEILNASGGVISWATAETTMVMFSFQNINSIGIGVLPAGTYHTRVSINRYSGGSKVGVYPTTAGFQGGQMIIQIFPD